MNYRQPHQESSAQRANVAERSLDESFTSFADAMRDYLVSDSAVLLYYQLSRILRRFIERSSLAAGAQFPTEDVIAVNFGVSRQTANRAVQELTSHGWLVRERGRGTFVRRNHPVDLTLLNDNLSMTEQFPQGASLKTEIVFRRIVKREPLVAETLGLPSDIPFLHLRRSRWVDEQPTIVCDSYLPAREFESLGETALVDGSLYKTLREQYGLLITRSERRVEAEEVFEPEVAELLQVPLYSPILLLTGITFVAAEDGERAVEFMNGYVRERVGFKSTVVAQSDLH